jgi:SAM-dependent methyltransferase
MPRDPLLAVQSSYRKLAAVYDRRWSRYVEASTRETLRRAALGPEDRVLDLGCGTGALLAAVRRLVPGVRITGVDLVPAMLAVARAKLEPSSRLLTAAEAGALPFRAATFDVVVSSNSFHYWPRPLAGLAEIARVLRPGGRLVLTDWCDDFLACRLCDHLLRLVDRAHHRAYRRAELERLLEQTGYRLLAVDRYKIDWLWGLMTATGSAVRCGPP